MLTQSQRSSRKFTNSRSSNSPLPALHTTLLLFENRLLKNDTILASFPATVGFRLYSLRLDSLTMRFRHFILLEYGFFGPEGLKPEI